MTELEKLAMDCAKRIHWNLNRTPDAYEQEAQHRTFKLILTALAAVQETSRYWKEQWVERGAKLAAEREKHKDCWDKATQEHYEQLEAEFGRLNLRFKNHDAEVRKPLVELLEEIGRTDAHWSQKIYNALASINQFKLEKKEGENND